MLGYKPVGKSPVKAESAVVWIGDYDACVDLLARGEAVLSTLTIASTLKSVAQAALDDIRYWAERLVRLCRSLLSHAGHARERVKKGAAWNLHAQAVLNSVCEAAEAASKLAALEVGMATPLCSFVQSP